MSLNFLMFSALWSWIALGGEAETQCCAGVNIMHEVMSDAR